MQNRSQPYQAVIYYTNRYNEVRWQTLVALVGQWVPAQRAERYRLSRLKRTPSEARATTIYKGAQAIARKYIDAAHREGRVSYIERSDGRYVTPATPPSTGGRYAKPATEDTSHPDAINGQAG